MSNQIACKRVNDLRVKSRDSFVSFLTTVLLVLQSFGDPPAFSHSFALQFLILLERQTL